MNDAKGGFGLMRSTAAVAASVRDAVLAATLPSDEGSAGAMPAQEGGRGPGDLEALFGFMRCIFSISFKLFQAHLVAKFCMKLFAQRPSSNFQVSTFNSQSTLGNCELESNPV